MEGKMRSDRAWRRVVAVVAGVPFVAAAVIMALPSAVSAGQGGLSAKPNSRLHNEQNVVVTGKGLTPGDEVVLMECLRSATSPTDCALATSKPATVSATGKIPATVVTVMTGNVGTGTCGTSISDYAACEIAAQDITGATTFAAYVNIKFVRNPVSPPPTVPGPPVPTTLPSSTTLPTIPGTTLPGLP
jgi:hypothetical protein